eukprot:Em0015g582a
MKEKHPEPSQSYPQAFLLSTHLPTLTDLDITSAHIATAANRIKGSAGPVPINSNMQSKLASEVDEAMASGMHDHSNSWHLATLAACFLDSAANAPTATLASLRVTGVRNDVTVTAAGFQGHLQGGSSAYAISHFDLHWEMGMSTEINKDVPQMVVPSNNISTMSAGGSMMTKWIKGNTRAKGAQRTACGI